MNEKRHSSYKSYLTTDVINKANKEYEARVKNGGFVSVWNNIRGDMMDPSDIAILYKQQEDMFGFLVQQCSVILLQAMLRDCRTDKAELSVRVSSVSNDSVYACMSESMGKFFTEQRLKFMKETRGIDPRRGLEFILSRMMAMDPQRKTPLLKSIATTEDTYMDYFVKDHYTFTQRRKVGEAWDELENLNIEGLAYMLRGFNLATNAKLAGIPLASMFLTETTRRW